MYIPSLEFLRSYVLFLTAPHLSSTVAPPNSPPELYTIVLQTVKTQMTPSIMKRSVFIPPHAEQLFYSQISPSPCSLWTQWEVSVFQQEMLGVILAHMVANIVTVDECQGTHSWRQFWSMGEYQLWALMFSSDLLCSYMEERCSGFPLLFLTAVSFVCCMGHRKECFP